MACIQDEHAVLQQLGFAQLFTANVMANQSRQHIILRIAWIFSPVSDQCFPVVNKFINARLPSALFCGQLELQRAKFGQRPAAQRGSFSLRHAQQVANHLHRNGRCKIFNQIATTFGLQIIQQAVNQRYEARLHACSCPVRERP